MDVQWTFSGRSVDKMSGQKDREAIAANLSALADSQTRAHTRAAHTRAAHACFAASAGSLAVGQEYSTVTLHWYVRAGTCCFATRRAVLKCLPKLPSKARHAPSRTRSGASIQGWRLCSSVRLQLLRLSQQTDTGTLAVTTHRNSSIPSATVPLSLLKDGQ